MMIKYLSILIGLFLCFSGQVLGFSFNKPDTNRTLVSDTLLKYYPSVNKSEYIITVLLPLHYDNTKQLTKIEVAHKSIGLAYLKGLQIAADSLTSFGYKLTINVVDFESPKNSGKSLYNTLKTQNPNLIIGPLFDHTIKEKTLDSTCALLKINRVSPLQTKAGTKNKYYYVETIPHGGIQGDSIAKYAYLNFEAFKFVIITENKNYDLFTKAVINVLPDAKLFILENNRSVKYDNIDELLFSNSENYVVFVASKNELFVTHALNILKKSKLNLTVIGMSNWINFKSISWDDWELFNIHLPATYWIDYKSDNGRPFVKKYREKWLEEPDVYAFLGFDDALFFGSSLFKYGPYFQSGEEFGLDKLMIHNKYQMKYDYKWGGWRNQSVRIIKFKSDQIKLIITE
ncbi:MAG: ABC transporter substrate-binding protein [Bacteroidota bacterium]|nr:ABC transporter substrate-binding protein [Bacteroidota bacterium]